MTVKINNSTQFKCTNAEIVNISNSSSYELTLRGYFRLLLIVQMKWREKGG